MCSSLKGRQRQYRMGILLLTIITISKPHIEPHSVRSCRLLGQVLLSKQGHSIQLQDKAYILDVRPFGSACFIFLLNVSMLLFAFCTNFKVSLITRVVFLQEQAAYFSKFMKKKITKTPQRVDCFCPNRLHQ